MDMELFDFKGNEVRVVLDDQGESSWIASDVAKALGYRDAFQLTRIVRERHKGYTKLCSTQVNGELHTQKMLTLTEAGLYAAIMKSQAKNVEEFQDWVTDEVLPSIRKHGGYISESATAEQLEGLHKEIEGLHRELEKSNDLLTEQFRTNDRTYGRVLELEKGNRRLKERLEVRAIAEMESFGMINVFEFMVDKTGSPSFAARFGPELLGRSCNESYSAMLYEDGALANGTILERQWKDGDFDKKYLAHEERYGKYWKDN